MEGETQRLFFHARNFSGPGMIFQPYSQLAQCDLHPYGSSNLSPNSDWPHPDYLLRTDFDSYYSQPKVSLCKRP